MALVRRVVCLANSRKLSGRCIAGKELTEAGPHPWVRPVSARPSEEVSEHERQYEDGSDPRVLDIIDIPLTTAHPKGCQTENWLLDPDRYWIRAGQMRWDELDALADDPPTLWLNGSSTSSGLNDRVVTGDAERLTESLYLLSIETLSLRVFAPGAFFGNPKRRVQGSFAHREVGYRLWVTDPLVEREYLAHEDGTYAVGKCLLTISLGEPHEGYCYKLIAAVIRPA